MNKFAIGKIQIENLKQALNNPSVKIDFGLSPPEPLILMDVFYNFDFDYYDKIYPKLIEFKKKLLEKIKYHAY